MKSEIVADGHRPFLQGKKSRTSESIEEKYVAEMAGASPEEKTKIQKRKAEEFLWREKILNHRPSARTLW